MGEVVRSGGERESERGAVEDGGSAAAAATVVRWERFLPRKVLRVLLVEADDSTRQIISALLRKCSYKVASVSDGLKAWEVLKGRPQNIDLILTEVDLPSISGFALLTLVMEHEICKKIPVIMMSSCDSVSTVYKCMLRGAADFLVKPVRINELRNLWQHVWRRQASSAAGGHGPQDESVAQQKVEATAENNATSNHSSGYMACIQRNRECIEKGSDAQSSCTKPEMEAERGCTGYVENTEPKWGESRQNDIHLQQHEEYVQKLLKDKSAVEGSVAFVGKEACKTTQVEENTGPAVMIVEACDNNQALGNSSAEAIDLIGAIDNYPRFSFKISGSVTSINKIDSSLLLDLSLRRSHPSGSVNQVTDERQMLHHSDASAFSRYVNKEQQQPHSTSASICNQRKDYSTDKQISNHGLNCNSQTHIPTASTQKNVLSRATGQSEMSFPFPQQKVFPQRVPVRGIRFENLGAAYGSVVPPVFHEEHSCQVNTFHQSNIEHGVTREFDDLHDQNANNSSNQTEHRQWQKKLVCLDTDHSTSSSFCNGGCNGNVSPVLIMRAAAECGNEGNIIHDKNSHHRSTLREAALTKFRLKRKDRCYEKKVRYETRKKLAEQRPRVKGQFVRQVHNDPTSGETDNLCGNSIDG